MSEYSEISFNVLDYKNDNVLSSYALESTPLTFIPNLSSLDYTRVLWEFGDGTHTTNLTASKYYTTPGRYVANLTIYDCFSDAVISTEYKILDIKDYITHTFKVDFDEPTYYDDIVWKNGKINGPIKISSYYPPSVTPTSIFYRISGSNSEYYFENTPYKFRHLEPTHTFLERNYNTFIEQYSYDEIDKITTINTSLYAKISGDSLIPTTANDDNGFYVGLSGYKEVYFRDDAINTINIDLFFDRSVKYLDGKNNLGVSLSANIIENDDVDSLSITSNGIDGEFYSVDTFNIDNKKFVKVDIPFVIKIKDSENYSVKNFPSLTATDVNMVVLSGYRIIDPTYYTIEDVSSFNGSTRGSIRFDLNDKLYDVQLSAVLTTNSDSGSSYTLNGLSNRFEVFPQNFISIDKINEDFDAKEMFKGLRFQEFLLDKEVLFENFMGSIFGTLSSSYDTLGKKIYEKITNFVENTQDVDRNEISSLISQMEMVGIDNNLLNSSLFKYPEKIKRIIDLGSISKNKLLGFENKFNENFDIRGHTSKDYYGTNLGDEINTDTYIIRAGTPIVALEKFSNNYTLLNTTQPVESLSATTYMMSAYNTDWGWPLVLPSTYQYSDLDKYYLFFEYTPNYEGTLMDYSIVTDSTIFNTLTSENILTTEDLEELLTESFEYILTEFAYDYSDYLLNYSLRDTLYQSLSLVHSD